jgi:putative hydrolase of the HAD superfamily
MANLPQALERLDLPDALTCQAWYLQQSGAGSLWQHVEAVGLASYHLAVMLRAAGYPVDPVLAHRGGLLHDIAKITAKKAQRDHGDMGAEILRTKGQPVLAEISLRHMLFYLADPHKCPRTWEEKIVHFADKICEGPRFVEWPERLEGLATRYPGSIAAMRGFTPEIEALQSELATAAGFPAEEMVPRLRAAINR